MSIYIHIPFCDTICSYCDFCKVYYNKKYIDSYLDNLEWETKERYQNEKVKTIYIGGGTPSSLSESEMIRLFEILKIFDMEDDYEFTFECNIESITNDKLMIMKKYGVHRISIGIQSFDDEVISFLGRGHNKNEAILKINLIKNYFDNINIDLIYAVYDDMEILKRDIKCFLELDIPHISTYSLIVEDNTMLKIKGYKGISEDLDYEMYRYIEKELEKNGYIHYEVSNYAKKGYESRHNLVYWNNDYYYGFGLSSTSYIDNKRRVNTKNLTKYLNGIYMEKENVENKEVRMENEVMLGLRKLSGINLDVFKNKFDVSLDEVYDIDDLICDGYLILEGNYLKINREYIYISNEILVRIFN